MSNKNSKSKRLTITVTICALLLLISMLCTFIGSNQNEKADSAVISNADTISTDLLLNKNTRDTAVNGNVFNLNALNELYNKFACADFTAVANKARVAKSTYNNSSVISIHAGMDSEQIRNSNS